MFQTPFEKQCCNLFLPPRDHSFTKELAQVGIIVIILPRQSYSILSVEFFLDDK